MKHPQVLTSHNVNELARLNMSYFDKIWLERQNVGVVESKCLGCALPLNPPVLSCSPTVSIDEERELGVVEQEFSIQPLYVDGLDIFSSRHKVQGCVGLIEQRLALRGLKRDDFEATSTANA